MGSVTEETQSFRTGICRDSYVDFVQEFWEEVPGAGKCTWNWHMDEICIALQQIKIRVQAGKKNTYDTIINVPPGSSKSSLCSILFIPWVWASWPEARFICATHTETLGLDLAAKSRELMRSEKYLDFFPHVRLPRTQVSQSRSYRAFFGSRGSSTMRKCPWNPVGVFPATVQENRIPPLVLR